MRARGRFSVRLLDEQVRTLRVLGVLALAMACIAVAFGVAGEARRVGEQPAASVARPVDPLRAEFQRCNLLGQAALDDDGCRRVWAEHRRCFFAGSS